MERSTEDDGPTSRLIRKGFDQFLADLTREWEALGQRTIPLDVCVFCAQFLPSSYTMGGDPEEKQRTQSPTNYSPGPNASVSPRPTPTYRLLSNDATRVLRIESPAAALNSMGHQYNQHRRLLTANDDVMEIFESGKNSKQQQFCALKVADERRTTGSARQ
ncbi:hypothetical protein GQ600_14716 [Phytophthora cactorum]|nr:hypothetical protein GQ600_14716 [Phytophthora cactorum]